MAELRISDDLSLPLDAVTQTFGVLAQRGVGKSYAMSVFAEELLKAGLQVVILDPLDVLWGLRASADGTKEGLQILVLGGSHGDIPLQAKDGMAIANLVVEQQISVILSLRHMSKGDQRRFVTDFCEHLYHRKGEYQYRQPLQIVIDEADSYIPQRVFAGLERMVGAIDDLVRRGRSSGIGVTLITQRASVINKDVLTQIGVLICLRTVSPQDRKALEAWVEAHDAEDQRKEFMSSLASLPIGTAWFWSPGWLGIFKKIKIRQRETFDSSATPKIGQLVMAPRTLAPVDIEQIKLALADSIEEVMDSDPKRLKERITNLEIELAQTHKAPATATKIERVIERVEVPIMTPHELDHLRMMAESFDEKAVELQVDRDRILTYIGAIVTRMKETQPVQAPLMLFPEIQIPVKKERPTEKSAPNDGSNILRAGERKMLEVVFWYSPRPITRVQLGSLSGYKHTGGTFGSYMSTLKRAGLVEENSGVINITTKGVSQAWAFGWGNDTQDTRTRWMGVLRAGERKILELLLDAYPGRIPRAELANKAGFEPTGGTFGTYLSTLRRNDLISIEDGEIKADSIFFT